MFATNHVLSGVVIGRAFERRPLTAFAVGLASHLVLDMVPHWGCEMKDPEGRNRFLAYARRDGMLGLAVTVGATVAVHPRARVATLAAIAGATLLDADKPALYFWGRNPFPRAVRRLHTWAQNEAPERLPNEIVFGASCAIADAVIAARGRRRPDAS